jgi:PAS domain S-box-containing protein
MSQVGLPREALAAFDRMHFVVDVASLVQTTSTPQQRAEGSNPFPATSLKEAMSVLLETDRRASDHHVKALLDRVNEAMLEGVLLYGPHGKITFVNDNLCHMLGRTREEMIGKPAAQYFGEITARCSRATQSGASGRSERYEVELRTKANRSIVVEVCSERVEDSNGAHLGCFAVMIDMTARANALRQAEADVRVLSAQFMAAQEVERHRIARELHDSIGQALGGVKFGLETCAAQLAEGSYSSVLNTVREFIARIQSAVEEVRRISMNLRPSTLDDLGIVPTLAWFTREFRAIYNGLDLDVTVDIREEEVAVPVKTAIYRIVQEAFHNVVNHSHARKVGLVLRGAANQIELRIQDNGAGFDPSACKVAKNSGRGLGLASMRERAELTGGRFSLSSEKGSGTTVRVSWPIHRPRRAAR